MSNRLANGSPHYAFILCNLCKKKENVMTNIAHTYSQHNWDALSKCPCTTSQHGQTDRGTHWDVPGCTLLSQLSSCNTVGPALPLPSSDSVSLLDSSLLPPSYPTLQQVRKIKLEESPPCKKAQTNEQLTTLPLMSTKHFDRNETLTKLS
jgi:hypothetical protein